jgi:glycosyltransferase involved in cell wall biosynthesis
MVREEAALLAAADVVTVCSAALVRSKGSTGTRTDGGPVLITNGVDLDRYRRPTDRPADLPDGPCAVYVGTLHDDRLDLELCVEAARRLAGRAGLVFVGPIALEPDQQQRLRQAGATLLGPRHRDQVPAYLQHADVLLVPHLVNAFTDSLDPIKLYEYQAVGRPVVSTPVSGFRDAEGPITVAAGDGFVSAVAAAVTTARVPATDPPPELPTWSRQAELMADQLIGVGRPAATSR